MTRGHRFALLLAAVVAAGACTNVLGLSDYADAAHELCSACDGIEACESTLDAKLDAATADEQRAWLATYDELDCSHAECNTTALQCFYSAPGNCAAEAAPCARPEACCDYDFAAPQSGGRCCVGDGDGACCATCRTCGEVLGDADPSPDLTDLCVTHRKSWDDLAACISDCCGGSPAKCPACFADVDKCKPQVNACNANMAP